MITSSFSLMLSYMKKVLKALVPFTVTICPSPSWLFDQAWTYFLRRFKILAVIFGYGYLGVRLG